MKSILKTTDLSIGYGKKPLLKEINFEINSGDIVALMGKNGCGKTTLLKTLTNLYPSLNGSIYLYGENIEQMNHLERAQKISIVLTQRPELSRLSVLEVLLMARYPYRTSEIENTEVAHKFAALLEIEDLLNKDYSLLSDGQKQIVLLCRALVQETKLIILDEPFTFLDMTRKLEVMGLLNKISKTQGISILYSTHDWELVYNQNPYVLLIEKDKVIFDKALVLLKSGNIENVLGHPQYTLDIKSGRFLNRN